MIVRLVKLEIQAEYAEQFAAFFQAEASQIQAWPGCHGVKAFRDVNQKSRFFTQSLWESEEALDQYRESDFFRKNWKTVKAWFAEPAQSWSTTMMEPHQDS